jgi:Protein of unknown function (DUF3300)
MSAWAGRVATHYFMAVLAVQITLSAASLTVFAQDQQDQQQRQPELQPQQQPQPQVQQQPLTQQQIQQLVAPIALYPDALLAQVLTASTYPLEVTMAARWSEKNPNLKERGARRCNAEAAMGSKRQGIDVGSASARDDEREVGLDQPARRGLSDSAQRYTKCGSSTAQTGRDDRQSEVEQGTEGQ